MKATSAEGLTGFILDTFDSVRVFRVYEKDSGGLQGLRTASW
jgi:hypothetical protein